MDHPTKIRDPHGVIWTWDVDAFLDPAGNHLPIDAPGPFAWLYTHPSVDGHPVEVEIRQDQQDQWIIVRTASGVRITDTRYPTRAAAEANAADKVLALGPIQGWSEIAQSRARGEIAIPLADLTGQPGDDDTGPAASEFFTGSEVAR
jgi:hypothetical protein